ncbi:hypothetical protein LPJ64_002337 [Coemansia asiatica]|uniref:Signal recognition particle subunit SRP14 n=1 Tax=Coemansia asiatica TaxID=1052880 RepID=A0A9W7XMY0_9FUNG|nr:hypothetical protein LPJ64_002337 [Coemansia asiatica]
MLLDKEKFLKALPALFEANKEKGSVAVTIKRFDYQGKAHERQKKRARNGNGEEAMRLLVDGLSLGDKEYATLVRAATNSKKISTLVAPADLDRFLACYHGLLLTNLESMKRWERLRKKKAAIKKQAAQKARAKAKPNLKAKPKSKAKAKAIENTKL